MIRGLYRGFSTYQYQNEGTFNMTDLSLVKMDLLNHIFTSKGERVMMPNFGTRIMELMHEPLDELTLEVLEEDLRAVFAFDPRVSLLDLSITPLYDSNTVIISAKLLYIELNMEDILDLNIVFENN